MSKHKSIPEKMQKYSELIDNTISDPVILSGVAVYGYTLEKVKLGKVHLDETAELIVKQGDEDAEQKHADDSFKALRSKIEAQFRKDRKLAKIALEEEPLLLKVNLGVMGDVSYNFPDLMVELNQFYDNALKSTEIMTAFGELNLSSEKLQAMQADIAALKSLKLTQKKEMGEAQMATKERDKKLSVLDKWAKRYKKVATIAFEDQPQILEKLGILVRS